MAPATPLPLRLSLTQTRGTPPQALRFGEEARTYRELAAEAEVMAHRLHALGVGPGSVVGLSAGPSPEAVGALVGHMQPGPALGPHGSEAGRRRV